MSERSVAVRLTANIAQYQAAMKDAGRSTDQLASTSSASFTKLGGDMHDVGAKMSRNVTLPLVGVAGAAIKLGNDFDTAFGQMVGLAGVPAGEVDHLKEAVLDLAGETARAPQELAEALYFAASAGLDSADAMDAVEIAAKGAAAGMGSTQDIVGLAAGAMSAYAKQGLTAAQATDILTATIREGRAEPAEMASTLGRILPVAAALGVSFDEVGGTVAFLTNTMGSTEQAVTGLQSMFNNLIAPTKQSADALEDAGTSSAELKAALDENGVLGALELLRTHGFDKNADALHAVIGDTQGYTAALQLLNGDSKALTDTLYATANATGDTGEAFAAVDPQAKKMKQAWVDIQIAMIQVGAIIGPLVAEIAGGVGGLANSFSDLDPLLQPLIISVAGLAAAAGPLLMVFGSLIRNFQTLKTAIAAANMSALVGPVGLAVVALGAAIAAISLFRGETDDTTVAVSDLGKAMHDLTSPIEATTQRIIGLLDESGELAAIFAGSGVTVGEYASALLNIGQAMDETGQSAGELKAHEEDLTAGQRAAVDEFWRVTSALYETKKAKEADGEASKAALDPLNGLTDQAAQAWREYLNLTAAIGKNTTATEGNTTATEAGVSSTDAATASLSAYLDVLVSRHAMALADMAAATDRARRSNELLAGAIAAQREEILGSLGGMHDYERAQMDTAAANDALTAAMKDGSTTAAELRDLQLNGAEAALRQAEGFAQAAGAADGSTASALLQREEFIRLAEEMPNLRDEILLYIAELDKIPATKTTQVILNGAGRAYTAQVTGASGRIIDAGVPTGRALGGPVLGGSMYEVLEKDEPEMLNLGGRSYLMSPSAGHVTPMSSYAGPSGHISPAGFGTSQTIDYARIGAEIAKHGNRVGQQVEHQHNYHVTDMDSTVRGWNALLSIA
jgi:TP901 family phage tail tape measure protein